MGKVRVLVVDDSVVIRRMLTDVLSADPAIEVAGHASNGRLAIQKLTQVQPDVVVMDVEMPEMNGIEALVEMRKTHKRLPIIMFSTLTTQGGAATLDALAKGATDYVAKPANVGSVQLAIAKVRDELVPKVRALGGAPDEHDAPATNRRPPGDAGAGAGAPGAYRHAVPGRRAGHRRVDRRAERAGRAHSRRSPATSACPSSWSSTCRRCSRSCSPSDSTASRACTSSRALLAWPSSRTPSTSRPATTT